VILQQKSILKNLKIFSTPADSSWYGIPLNGVYVSGGKIPPSRVACKSPIKNL